MPIDNSAEFAKLIPSESLLVTAVAGLLERMPGTKETQIVHGPSHRVWDILFYSEGPFGDVQRSACVVKQFVNRKSISRRLHELTLRIQMALNDEEHPFARARSGGISRVYIITPFDLSPRLMSELAADVHLRSRVPVEFIAGARLLDLFRVHWPDFLVDRMGVDAGPGPAPVKLFIFYAYQDQKYRDELQAHLKLLQRNGVIESWSDRDISRPGADIDLILQRADVILALLSPDFLASDYVFGDEMKSVMDRHHRGEARLIPIVVRESDWRRSPLQRLQALPVDGRPIQSWRDRDSAWRSVVEGIGRSVRGLRTISRPRRTLKIASIRLKNIRCFKQLHVDFKAETAPAQFMILFGENGLGKTTVLRSLALCMCPESKGSGLAALLPGDLLSADAKQGSVEVEVVDDFGKLWTSRLVMERHATGGSSDASGAETVRFRRETDAQFPHEQVFLCAYGAARRSIAVTEPSSDYEVDSAVRSLFDYSTSLQNPELIFRRSDSLQRSTTDMMLKLDAALGLEPGSTMLDSTGIRIQGPWGSFVPLGGLGDGYQSTLAWLTDFLGHQLLFDPQAAMSDISGIVLIDELEQHLHPRWQRNIISTLSEQFPSVQFIATSHSPVCAGGLADVRQEDAAKLFVLESKNGRSVGLPVPIPSGLRYDEIMTSRVIGLDVARDRTTAELLERLRNAYDASGGQPDQSPEFQRIMQALNQLSATAGEDTRRQYVEEEARSLTPLIEQAVREAKKKR